MARKRANGEGSIFKYERKRKRKDGTTVTDKGWQAELLLGYKEDGSRNRKYIYGKTQREVKEKLDQAKAQFADGSLTAEKLSVAAYLKHWLSEKVRQIEDSTAEAYERLIRVHIVPCIGKVQLAKLSALQVQAMMGDIADTVGTRTANAARTLLFSAIKQAVRWQLVPRNVAEAVDPLKHVTKESNLWTAEEASSFLKAIRGHRLYAALYLELSTGLRRGELLGLRWQDVQGDSLWAKQQLVVSKGEYVFKPTKTERSTRRVAVSPDVVAVLEQHLERQQVERAFLGGAWPDTGLVFVSEVGTPIHPRNFDRTWKKLKKKANVPHIRLHDLRHFHISLLVKQGFDPRAVADRVGHTDPAFTLRRYSHMFDEQRSAMAISITDLLKSPPRAKPNVKK